MKGIKLRKSLFFALIFTVLFGVGINKVSAASGAHFGVELYNCSQEQWDNEECFADNTKELEEGIDLIPVGSDLEPGQQFMIAVKYRHGNVDYQAIQAYINYDSDLIVFIDGYHDRGPTYMHGGVIPPINPTGTAANKRNTNWAPNVGVAVDAPYYGDAIYFSIRDKETQAMRNGDEGLVYYFLFQVVDDASLGGRTINLSFMPGELEGTVRANGSADRAITYTNASYNIFGTMSTDSSLSHLEVKNGTTTYPVVERGTSKVFDVVVPNNISNVNLIAIVNDLDYATITVPNPYNRVLTVGDNSITFTVTAQNGTTTVYTINIKRLSNDVSLTSMTLDGISDLTYNSATKTYSKTVPYLKASTTVTAVATHNKAVVSGNGSWNLTNIGGVNTKTVTVNAENCASTYASVPGNTCTTETYTLNITRTAASTNANLSDLKVDDVLVSGFSGSTYDYYLNDVANAKTSINITATIADSLSRIVSGTGTKALVVGDNVFEVVTMAEDGVNTNTYRIHIRRKSDNANLAGLSITSSPQGTLDPVFSPTLYNYHTFNIDALVSSITITPTKGHLDQVIAGDIGTIAISSTSVDLNISVTAEDGNVNTYVIRVRKSLSPDNTLSSLTVSEGTLTPVFNSGTTLYNVTVPFEVTSLDVAAIANNSKAVIETGTGTKTLNVGTNTIQVRVKAENNTTKDYTITVTREASTNAYLSDILIDGVSIESYNKTNLTYTMPLVGNDKTSVNVTYVKDQANSTVTGGGVKSLVTGNNVIQLTVTAADGVTNNTYTINIERDLNDYKYLANIKLDNELLEGFVFDTNVYNITVPNDVKSLNLSYGKAHVGQTVSVAGNLNFVTTANNEVQITVTSEKGSIFIYTINVTRTKSSEAKLSNIGLSSGLLNPAFNENTYAYTVTVPREVTTMMLTPTVKDSAANAVVTGNSSLAIGDNNFSIKVTAEDNTELTYTVKVVRTSSNNTYLSHLTIDGNPIAGFSKTNRSYTVNVSSEVTNVVIGGSAEYPAYTTVEGLGSYSITTGINTIKVKVIAEDLTEEFYTINVNRLSSANKFLSSLSIQETSLNEQFVQNVSSYTASVANNVTSINIEAIAADTRSTVTGDGLKSLNTGDNVFTITVTAEDNTQNTYTLTVTRARNSDAFLKNITLSGGFQLDPVFDKNTTTYSVVVPNEMPSINVVASKNDAKATVTGDGLKTLNTGNNVVTITVTAENGQTTKTYTVNVYREKSTNAYLRDITSPQGIISPDFNKLVNTGYEMIVTNDVVDVTFNITKDQEASSYVISGAETLVVGNNTVTIMVTPEEGTINIYEIVVRREASDNNYLKSIVVTDASLNNYPLDFSKTELEYSISVGNNVDKITVAALTDSTTAQIRTTLGTKNLNVGPNRLEIVVRSESGVDRTYVLNVTRLASNDAFLANLSVTGYNINPVFTPATTLYNLTVAEDVTEVEILASANASGGVVTGTGTKQLVTGINSFQITVTAEDGVTFKDYTVVITKTSSNNNNLASLSVSEGSLDPVFNKNTPSYEVNVPYAITEIELVATTEHERATVSGVGTKTLATGDNTFTVVVKAEDNTTKTYTVVVKRAKSSNKLLLDLTVDGTTIEGFEANKYNYAMNVANNKTSVDIVAIPTDAKATVLGDGTKSLVTTATNVINITIIAEDGTTEILKVSITRAKSSNNYLSSLSTSEAAISPAFNKETLSYDVTVPFEVRSLNINAIKEDNSATISSIDGNSEFVTSGINVVSINVVAEDGSVRTYRLNVTRQIEANNFLSSISVSDTEGNVYPLDKVFNRNTMAYEVLLPISVGEVVINTTKENGAASVNGAGNVQISTLPYTQNIVVTSSGVTRTYTVTFKRALSDNNKLLSLTSDIGTIDFNPTKYTYVLNVPASTTGITLTATKGEESQTVLGAGYHAISSNQQMMDITVTSENGTSSIYTVVVIREAAVALKLSDLSVEDYVITPGFNPNTSSYTLHITDETVTSVNVIYDKVSSEHNVVVSGADSLAKGENLITVTVSHGGNETVYTIIVTIDAELPKKIASDIHTLTADYIMTFAPEQTVMTLKNQLTNENQYLKVYDQDGTEVSDASSEYIGTGYVVKLLIDGTIHDELMVVVKGDVDGNGEVEALDARAIALHVIGTRLLSSAYFEAAYLIPNDEIEVEALHARAVAMHVIGTKLIDYVYGS